MSQHLNPKMWFIFICGTFEQMLLFLSAASVFPAAAQVHHCWLWLTFKQPGSHFWHLFQLLRVGPMGICPFTFESQQKLPRWISTRHSRGNLEINAYKWVCCVCLHCVLTQIYHHVWGFFSDDQMDSAEAVLYHLYQTQPWHYIVFFNGFNTKGKHRLKEASGEGCL